MRVFAAFAQRRGPSAARERSRRFFFGFDCFQGLRPGKFSPRVSARLRPARISSASRRTPQPAPGASPPGREHPTVPSPKPSALQTPLEKRRAPFLFRQNALGRAPAKRSEPRPYESGRPATFRSWVHERIDTFRAHTRMSRLGHPKSSWARAFLRGSFAWRSPLKTRSRN
jgi:hypothetical protein